MHPKNKMLCYAMARYKKQATPCVSPFSDPSPPPITADSPVAEPGPPQLASSELVIALVVETD